MFTFDSIVRFSETDANQLLSLSGIINYFQDCSEFHSETVGSGVEKLGNYAWILNSWQIQIKRYPKLSEPITICTLPHMLKGIEGHRNFLIKDKTGAAIVNANSIWTYFDKTKQRPTRITKDQYECYKPEPAYPMEYAPRRIDIKDIPENAYKESGSLTVMPSQLDMYGHMNNCQYITIACDYLPRDYSFSQVRVEYQRSAMLSDTILVKQYHNSLRLITLLTNSKGIPYSILEYT